MSFVCEDGHHLAEIWLSEDMISHHRGDEDGLQYLLSLLYDTAWFGSMLLSKSAQIAPLPAHTHVQWSLTSCGGNLLNA